jgi:hypothetical protein
MRAARAVVQLVAHCHQIDELANHFAVREGRDLEADVHHFTVEVVELPLEGNGIGFLVLEVEVGRERH